MRCFPAIALHGVSRRTLHALIAAQQNLIYTTALPDVHAIHSAVGPADRDCLHVAGVSSSGVRLLPTNLCYDTIFCLLISFFLTYLKSSAF
jgi:hypothetical protein